MTSTSGFIADLIESGLDAREQEEKRFFEFADRLSRSRDPEEQKCIKEELARMTFGERSSLPNLSEVSDLRGLLLEGAGSAPAEPADAAYFNSLRKRAQRRARG